jgi:hypothetical protein
MFLTTDSHRLMFSKVKKVSGKGKILVWNSFKKNIYKDGLTKVGIHNMKVFLQSRIILDLFLSLCQGPDSDPVLYPNS